MAQQQDRQNLASSQSSKTNELHVAAASGDLEGIKNLIESGLNINCRNLNSEGIDHFTPLHFAVTYGQLNAVKYLIDLGADIDAKDRSRLTPLYRAISLKLRDIVVFLLERGADVLTRDSNGLHACFWAAKTGDIEIFKIIWNTSVWDLSDTDKNGLTIFHYATKNAHWQIVKFLIQFNPDPNHADLNGMTPLKRAAKAGKWDIVSLLLKNNGAWSSLSEEERRAVRKSEERMEKKQMAMKSSA